MLGLSAEPLEEDRKDNVFALMVKENTLLWRPRVILPIVRCIQKDKIIFFYTQQLFCRMVSGKGWPVPNLCWETFLGVEVVRGTLQTSEQSLQGALWISQLIFALFQIFLAPVCTVQWSIMSGLHKLQRFPWNWWGFHEAYGYALNIPISLHVWLQGNSALSVWALLPCSLGEIPVSWGCSFQGSPIWDLDYSIGMLSSWPHLSCSYFCCVCSTNPLSFSEDIVLMPVCWEKERKGTKGRRRKKKTRKKESKKKKEKDKKTILPLIHQEEGLTKVLFSAEL